jgi:hypothetical protein
MPRIRRAAEQQDPAAVSNAFHNVVAQNRERLYELVRESS